MFYLISKNQYPYETLHTDRCGAVNRSYRAQSLGYESIGRLELYRIDICSRCLPRVLDADGLPDGYHPDHLELFRIQREYKAKQATDAQTSRLARQVVALEIALEKARAEATEFGIFRVGTRGNELYTEYARTMREGTYTPDELDVTVGRASITKRPSSY